MFVVLIASRFEVDSAGVRGGFGSCIGCVILLALTRNRMDRFGGSVERFGLDDNKNHCMCRT